MKRMSFMLTKEQVLDQTKTVTRRNGWKNLKEGDLIQPVEKCMGLKKGEKQVKLGCPIRVLSIQREPLNVITSNDLIKEGFPHFTREEFIKLYLSASKGNEYQIVTRIEFEYLNRL